MPAKPRYPWDTWFGRRTVTITRGKDFTCMPHSMMIQVRANAIKRKLDVSVNMHDDSLTITVKGKRSA